MNQIATARSSNGTMPVSSGSLPSRPWTIESCITNGLLEAYKKGAGAKEGLQQRGVALEPASGAARAGHEGLHSERGPVGQGRSLQGAPGVFNGVQLGGRGREADGVNP